MYYVAQGNIDHVAAQFTAPRPRPLAAIVSLLLAANWLALVPLTTGAPLVLAVPAVLGGSLLPMAPPALAVPAGLAEALVDCRAGVANLEVVRVVRGVGGFSTNEVSDVLVMVRDIIRGIESGIGEHTKR